MSRWQRGRCGNEVTIVADEASEEIEGAESGEVALRASGDVGLFKDAINENPKDGDFTRKIGGEANAAAGRIEGVSIGGI